MDSSSSDGSDSDTTQNSVENGKRCIVRTVRFRHFEYSFERQVFVNLEKECLRLEKNGKRLSTSPIRSHDSVKKICLQTNLSNNLFVAEIADVQDDVRICGVLNLTTLFKESLRNVPIKDLMSMVNDIDFSCPQECVEQIEYESRRLSDKSSRLLSKLQVGRISGSVFKDVSHSHAKCPSKQLLNRIYHLNKVEDRSDVWFRQNFSTVRMKYERIMLNRHGNFEYRKCGLVLSSDHPQFCVTPGGIVECDCCGRGITEFYLPYEIRNEKMIYSLPCLDETDDYEFSLRQDSELYYKIQLNMFVTDTKYCDFVIWTACDFLDIRIKRDDDFLFVKVNSAKSFFLRKILPDMLGKIFSG